MQENPTSQTNVGAIDPVGATLMLAFPVFVICAIVSHQKHRATVLRQRIQQLNHIWQLDDLKKRP